MYVCVLCVFVCSQLSCLDVVIVITSLASIPVMELTCPIVAQSSTLIPLPHVMFQIAETYKAVCFTSQGMGQIPHVRHLVVNLAGGL